MIHGVSLFVDQIVNYDSVTRISYGNYVSSLVEYNIILGFCVFVGLFCLQYTCVYLFQAGVLVGGKVNHPVHPRGECCLSLQ